ncbi:hypothetical protein H2203_004284 [Taxawa tesnikishii (nom. ined.)]|nr:hypothetical protein H2203_004284 [Dothideales sp. JES 119]
MAPPETMDKFTKAMRHVYQFPLGEQSPRWTPPPMKEGHRGRYLWTDAFGVLNLITLSKETSHPHYLNYATSLTHTVHETLGRTRDLSSRLPGATDASPLSGGLRIGKEDAEGSDGDGQYHHYLTLWMFALNRLSVVTRDRNFNDQAVELAKAIHPRFVYNRDSARPRMVWKMSMDLSRPLVRSEGNLDPIDGYVVYKLLQQTAGGDVLKEEIADYKKILDTKWRDYSSSDTLDLGMTLWTAHWFAGDEEWASGLANAAERDMRDLFEEDRYLDHDIRRRLAFREFGTCLGIRARGMRGWNRLRRGS